MPYNSPLVHAQGHLSPALLFHTYAFSGGFRGACELATLLCICTLSMAKFQVLMHVDPSASLETSLKSILYTPPLPWVSYGGSITCAGPNSPSSSSQLWAMTSSVSLFFLIRNHGLLWLGCFLANVIEYLRCTSFGLEEENSAVSINRPGPCLTDFTVWSERNTWMR